MGKEFDDIRLPKGVQPLPVMMKKAGYFTFNQSGKDDYNFKHDRDDMYNDPKVTRSRKGAPAALVAGDCWKGRKPGQPFFGQVQLKGGKLGRRAPTVIDRAKVPVPPYYPDIPEVREEIAHHYDCLLKSDEQVGEIITALKRDELYKNTLIICFSDHGYE